MFDKVDTQQIIPTERFTLRPLRRSDAGLMQLYAGDERVARNTSRIPHPLPPGAIDGFIARTQAADRAEDVWAIDGTTSGLDEVLGVISLKRMDRNQSEIGYWVAPIVWNSGIATEAVIALTTANPHDDDTLFGAVFQDNPASARVLTQAGFDYIGDAATWCVARDAQVPTWTYLKRLG